LCLDLIFLGKATELPANESMVEREEGSPAALRSLIGTSSGHGVCPADVIIAITLWPAGRLKAAASEITRAGRFFSAWRSVNGNGTRTTS
jgi:hypothetical protein